MEEAWTAINAIDESKPGWIPFEWEEVRLDVMEALGRKDDAQRFRWQCFERGLNSDHLRAFLKRLPDFDDLEAEERAALRFTGVHQQQTRSQPNIHLPQLSSRAMIDFALQENRVKRYRHAARYLMECAGLAAAINDFGRVEPS